MTLQALLIVTLLNLAAGFGALQLLPSSRFKSTLDPLEKLLLLVGAGVLVNSVVGMLLVDLGVFSLGLLALPASLLAVAGLWRSRTRTASLPPSDRPPLTLPFTGRSIPVWVEYLLVALWAVAAGMLFFRPHEITFGGADAGVYVNLAAHIANEGSVRIDEPVLADLDPSLYDAFLRTMPDGSRFWSSGLLVTDTSGRIWPPFYHLHAMWQAAAYAVAEVPGALHMTPYWALWSTFSVFMVLRRLLSRREGWWIALLGLGVLTITAIQIWFARYPTSEMLTQFLFWFGLWAFIIWGEQKYRGSVWALMAGGAWGATFLVRVDTFFVWIIPAVLLVLLSVENRWNRSQAWFFAPLLVLPLFATTHALLFARPYFETTYGYLLSVALSTLWWLAPIALLGAGGLLFLMRNRRKVRGLVEKVWPTGRWLLVTAGAGLFLYAWFLRPILGAPLYFVNPWDNVPVQNWSFMSMRHLGWYLFPTGVAISATGILWLWWDLNRRTWALLLLGTVFSLLYLSNIRANGIHMYSLRRYVPVIIPFFVVAATMFGAWLYGRRNIILRAMAPLLLVIWLLGVVWTTRGFLSQVDFVGLPDQIGALADRFPDGSILLFNQARSIDLGDHLGVPLTLIHGHHAFTLHHMDQLDQTLFDDTLRQWQEAGRNVYWIELTESNVIPLAPDRLTYDFTFEIPVTVLEGTYDRKPVQIQSHNWTGKVYRLLPAAAPR